MKIFHVFICNGSKQGFFLKNKLAHTIDELFAAILGHISAHSFATGPETAEPFISPFGFTITPALSKKCHTIS